MMFKGSVFTFIGFEVGGGLHKASILGIHSLFEMNIAGIPDASEGPLADPNGPGSISTKSTKIQKKYFLLAILYAYIPF